MKRIYPKLNDEWLEINEKTGLVRYSEEMESHWLHTRETLSIMDVTRDSKPTAFSHHILSFPFYQGQTKGEYNAMVKACSLPMYFKSAYKLIERLTSGLHKPKNNKPDYHSEVEKLIIRSPKLKSVLEKLDKESDYQVLLRKSKEVLYRDKHDDIEKNKSYFKKHPHKVGDKVLVFNTYWNYMGVPVIDKIIRISEKGNVFLSNYYGWKSPSQCFYKNGQHYHEPHGQVWFIPYARANELIWLCDDETRKKLIEKWENF